MDDTHTTQTGQDPADGGGTGGEPEPAALAELAAVDPADAPELAEAYAEQLGRQLEEVSATDPPIGGGGAGSGTGG
jgi:hypothetical protein